MRQRHDSSAHEARSVREPDKTLTNHRRGAAGGRRLAMPTGSAPAPPPIGSARHCSRRSSPGPVGRGSADQALAGLSFADLFAGSGAVGLEAASRGAAPVLLIERSRRTATLAARNAQELALEVGVVTASVEAWVRQPADHTFDVIFADPPYEFETTAVEDLLTVVLEHGWLAESGLVVVERSSRSSPIPWPAGLTPLRPRAYGETVLYFGGAIASGTDVDDACRERRRVDGVQARGHRDPRIRCRGRKDVLSRRGRLRGRPRCVAGRTACGSCS